MPWDPATYLQFKDVRFRPFFDLMNLVNAKGLHHGVDIGCGTGEQTALLSQRFEGSRFLGIDASKEMLAVSKQFENSKLHFELSTVEQFVEKGSKWDLIFSNAALQWCDDHHALFAKLISKLHVGGQLAVQMPYQKENALNHMLLELVDEKPFVDLLNGFKKTSPLL